MSKISYTFEWKGQKEDDSNIKGFNPAKLEDWRQSDYVVKHNGYGYVCFKNEEDADKALKQKNYLGMKLYNFDLNLKKE